jgi:hypothetical protein
LKSCSYPDCDRSASSRNLCKSHAQQLRLLGELRPLTPRGRHNRHVRGQSHPRWNHVQLTSSEGYILTRVDAGNHLNIGNGYAYEHRVVMEQQLGRPLLSTEHVDHINGDRTDNRPENLRVLSASEHQKRHNAETRRRDSSTGRWIKNGGNTSKSGGDLLEGQQYHQFPQVASRDMQTDATVVAP